MAKIRIDKVISNLPAVLVPNTIYTVRNGVGFDLYMSDVTGTTAHALNLLSKPITQTINIVKNVAFNITATSKIISITIFNPATGRLITPQPTLVADRLSGTVKINQNITNAEITINTL